MSHSKRPTPAADGGDAAPAPPASPISPEGAPSESTSRSPAESELSLEQLAELRSKAARADEFQDHYLRARADLDNYRKRATRERQEAVQYANESLLRSLLPILDSFEMALAASSQPGAAPPESLRTGIDMIHGQLRSVLTDAGLQEVDANGSAFDPQLHEALCQQDSTAVPEGHVLQQVRKGYRLRDRLVRPASVIVARKPAT